MSSAKSHSHANKSVLDKLADDGGSLAYDGSPVGGGGGTTLPTGTRLTGYWSAAPSGYVLADGTTIGNADSGATGRAHADTSDLFELLWAHMDDALAPVSGGRGASAAADFAADKTITLPDERLRVAVMRSGAMFAGLASVLGAVGGEETHALSTDELAAHIHAGPSHTHDGVPTGGTAQRPSAIPVDYGSAASVAVDDGNNYGLTLTGSGSTGASGTGDTGSTGSGLGHNNVQPFICVTVAIKL